MHISKLTTSICHLLSSFIATFRGVKLLITLLSPKMPNGLNEHTSCANTTVPYI